MFIRNFNLFLLINFKKKRTKSMTGNRLTAEAWCALLATDSRYTSSSNPTPTESNKTHMQIVASLQQGREEACV